MNNLSSTAGVVAIAGAAVAVIALLAVLALTVSLRRLRAAQTAVLGDTSQDLVGHAATLQQSFESLAQYVEDVGSRLEARVGHAEQRLNGAIVHRALVRYDAYGEMSGRQSTSLALLDATTSGVVLSSIHHRDTARLYVKQIRLGKPELELSPEESEAIRLALAGEGAGGGAPSAGTGVGAAGGGISTGGMSGTRAGTASTPASTPGGPPVGASGDAPAGDLAGGTNPPGGVA